MTSFLGWAMSLIAAPPVFQPPEIPAGHAWCASKLCDTYRIYDVIPAIEETKLYGAVPAFAFCVHCGDQVDVDLPEPEEAA